MLTATLPLVRVRLTVFGRVSERRGRAQSERLKLWFLRNLRRAADALSALLQRSLSITAEPGEALCSEVAESSTPRRASGERRNSVFAALPAVAENAPGQLETAAAPFKVTLRAAAVPVAAVHAHGTRRAGTRAGTATPDDFAALSLSGPSSGASKTGFVYDPRMAEHRPPADTQHFEQPGRVRSIFARLHRENLLAQCAVIPAREASCDELHRVHSEAHVSTVGSFDGRNTLGDPDLYGSAGTPTAARLAAGCVTAAALAVHGGALINAFALVRPPGHHAGCCSAQGFCFFNNVAVAARAVLAAGARRVAIVDWDVHHGNGTQDTFSDDSSVLYLSLHRYTPGFFPGTGGATDKGVGPGAGFSVNVPWTETGLMASDYLAAFRFVLLPILHAFSPDLILISAGYDAAAGDPLGGMALAPSAYGTLTEQLCQVGNGRVVAALEGGYNEDAISACAEATMRALLRGGGAAVNGGGAARRGRVHAGTPDTLQAVRAAQAEHWPCLRDNQPEFAAWAAEEREARATKSKPGAHTLTHAQPAAPNAITAMVAAAVARALAAYDGQ